MARPGTSHRCRRPSRSLRDGSERGDSVVRPRVSRRVTSKPLSVVMILPAFILVSLGRPRLENDDRRLCRPMGDEAVEVLAPTRVVAKRGPQSISFLAEGDACPDGTGFTREFDGRLRLCLEVQPPGGILVPPAVHGEGDEVRAV